MSTKAISCITLMLCFACTQPSTKLPISLPVNADALALVSQWISACSNKNLQKMDDLLHENMSYSDSDSIMPKKYYLESVAKNFSHSPQDTFIFIELKFEAIKPTPIVVKHPSNPKPIWVIPDYKIKVIFKSSQGEDARFYEIYQNRIIHMHGLYIPH